MILQIFVEKKKEYDSLSSRLLYLIKKNVKLDDNADLRVFRKFVIENVGTEFYETIKHKILSDETVDNVYLDFLPVTTEYRQFVLESPKYQRQTDVINIKKCFELCGINSQRSVKTSLVFACGKGLKEATVKSIRNAVVTNGLEKIFETERLNQKKKAEKAKKPIIEDFIKMNDIDVYQFHRKNNIKMTSEDFCKLRDFYKTQNRDPLWLEVKAIDSCWSRTKREPETMLEKIEIKDSALNIPVEIALDEYMTARKALYGDRKVPVTLNDMASIGLMALKQRGQATDVDRLPDGKLQIQMPVDIDGVYEQWVLTFKSMKSSFDKGFDCFGEAVGSHITDRTSAYQAINVNCIGYENIKNDNADIGSQKLTDAVASFMAHNAISVCEYNSVIANSESMNIKFTASAAAAPKTNMQKPIAAVNDAIIMIGDKISNELLPHDELIQKGNPMIKQNIQKLLRNSKAAGMIKRSSDLSNGLVCAIFDITDDGVIIDLDRVIGRDNVDAAAAISRPIQGAVILCSKEDAATFISLARQTGVFAHNIAVTDTVQSFRFFVHGKLYTSIDRKLLKYKGSFKKSNVLISAPSAKLFYTLSEEFMKLPVHEAFLKNLNQYNYNETSNSDNQYDWGAGSAAVLAPKGGKFQSTPEESHISKIPSGHKMTNTVTVMSYGSTPKITAISPFHGAAYSIMEAVSKIVAGGGNSLNVKLAFAEHFLDPASAPIKWSEPCGAMLGAFEAQMSMGLPSVDNTISIEPVGNFKSAFTFTAFAVAASKSNEIISAEFKNEDSTVLLIPMPIVPKTGMPDFDKAKIMYRQFHYLSQSSKVISAAVVKAGGVANAVAKMSFGNGIGVKFATTDYNTLFGDKTASIIVETKNPGAFSGMDTVMIGKTVKQDKFIFDNEEIAVSEAVAAFRNQNDKAYWRLFSKNITMADIPLYEKRADGFQNDKFLKPRVLIPTFDAQIGENDLERGFESAGGLVTPFPFDFHHIEESKETLASIIEKSQIIALPNSDESLYAKNLPVFALSDTKVNQAIQSFLLKGGLILGVGTGFYALLKLGLLGINAINASFAPNVNANRISTLVRTRVTSVKSPWLSMCKPGSIHTVYTSGLSGRFVTDESTITLLSANGRIATQYVDINGKPTAKHQYNPSGSVCAIEGITSATGSVFGKAALSERYTNNCFANVPGSKDQHLFEAGINYFM